MPEIEVKPERAADPNTRRVGILVGVVGILLSLVTIASHRAHTQAVIHRTESNDAWAYYQAKKNREYTSDVAITLLKTFDWDSGKRERPLENRGDTCDRDTAEAERMPGVAS